MTTADTSGTPRNEWVKPRWWAKANAGPPMKRLITSISGASAASVRVSVASAVLRFKPARPRHAPVRKWVTGSKRSGGFYLVRGEITNWRVIVLRSSHILPVGVILSLAALQAEGRISRGPAAPSREVPREIPRPAGESAGLRDDAFEKRLTPRFAWL